MTYVALQKSDPIHDIEAGEALLTGASPQQILTTMLGIFKGRIAAVSSFGTESAVLLSMIAEIDPSAPVLFLDTGYLFKETLDYRDMLVERLGLSDVRVITPDPAEAAQKDPENALWAEDPDACCALRKVAPLAKALAPFDAWINGRKRYHGNERARLQILEAEWNRIKINPLARMSREEINAYFNTHDLPRHPLEAMGFLSVGCMPCTSRTRPGEDIRSGRWRGRDKTECGIHSAGLTAAYRPAK